VILYRQPILLGDVSLVLGVFSAFLGFMTSLAAIAIGAVALARIRRGRDHSAGRGCARGGLILGIIFTFFGGASLLALGILFPSLEAGEILEQLSDIPSRVWRLLGM